MASRTTNRTAKKAAAKKAPVKKATPATRAPASKPAATSAGARASLAPKTSALVMEIPIGKIQPSESNLRADVGDITGLAASIAAIGILEPIIVETHPSKVGQWIVIGGHRRLAGAKHAKLATVPCIERSEVTDEDRAEIMLIENLQREGLKPLEEAVGFQRLLDAKWSQRKIAERIGCNQSHVSRRVQLLALPESAQKAVAAEKITVNEALELVRIADAPEAIDKIVKSASAKDLGGYAPDIGNAVRRHQQAADDAAKVDALRAKLEKDGVNILPDVLRDGIRRLDEMWNDDNIKKHVDEPCHAVQIGGYQGEPRPVPYCTNPKNHNKTGQSGLKLPDKKTAKESALTPEQREQRETADARRTFMRQAVTIRQLQRDVIVEATTRRYIAKASTDERRKMGDLLGLDPILNPLCQGGKDWRATIDDYVAASEPNRLRACLAFALVQGEWDLGCAQDDHLALLTAIGYQPTTAEQGLLDAAEGDRAYDTRTVEQPSIIDALEEAGEEPTLPVGDAGYIPGDEGNELIDEISDGDTVITLPPDVDGADLAHDFTTDTDDAENCGLCGRFEQHIIHHGVDLELYALAETAAAADEELDEDGDEYARILREGIEKPVGVEEPAIA